MLSFGSFPGGSQHLRDLCDCIPVSRGDRYIEEAVELAEVTDDLHMTAIHAKNESIPSREDLQQPPSAGRETERHQRLDTGSFGQDAHETDDAWLRWLKGERIPRYQPGYLTALANNYMSIKRKPACHFGAESRPGDRLADHEGAGRADVDGIEMFQLSGKQSGSEGLVTADVHTSQKNHECHSCIRDSVLRNIIRLHQQAYRRVELPTVRCPRVEQVPESNFWELIQSHTGVRQVRRQLWLLYQYHHPD